MANITIYSSNIVASHKPRANNYYKYVWFNYYDWDITKSNVALWHKSNTLEIKSNEMLLLIVILCTKWFVKDVWFMNNNDNYYYYTYKLNYLGIIGIIKYCV
jgi:hypothetical protein